MSDDPRAEARVRTNDALTLERVKRGLSPTDDDLPLGQAIRHADEMKQAAASYRKLRRKAAGPNPATAPVAGPALEEGGQKDQKRGEAGNLHQHTPPTSSTPVENVEGPDPRDIRGPRTEPGSAARPSTPTENE